MKDRFSNGIAIIIVCVFVVWLVCLSSSSVQIGCIRWVYLGDNASVLKCGLKTVIGPGNIELRVSSDIVYGVCYSTDISESYWFAVCTKTGKVYLDDCDERVEQKLIDKGLVSADFAVGGPLDTYQTFRRRQKCFSD